MLSGPTRFLALLLALLPAPLFARASALCDQAAERASFATGVPVEVLRALTRTETGRSGPNGPEPWPWAVNQGGTGHWFDAEAEAEDLRRVNEVCVDTQSELVELGSRQFEQLQESMSSLLQQARTLNLANPLDAAASSESRNRSMRKAA